MSSSCHSRWLVGEGSDNNDAVDHGEDQVLGDDDSQGGHERGGEDTLEEDINWHASAFYIGKFFTKQPDSTAKCKEKMKLASMKTQVMMSLKLSFMIRIDRSIVEVFYL